MDDSSAAHFRLAIARAASFCFERFAAVERVSEWLTDVRSAKIRSYDDDGQPREVDFMASTERGGLLYKLTYEVDPATLTIAWKSMGRLATVRALRGQVQFVATGSRRCEMVYETEVHVGVALPASFAEAYRSEGPEEVCTAFKAWVEGA